MQFSRGFRKQSALSAAIFAIALGATPLVQAQQPTTYTVQPVEKSPYRPLQVAPIVRSPAWIVMDVDSGRVLKEFSSHRRMFPASTTKTLTALTAIRYGNLDGVTVIGPSPPLTGEQSANLLQGEKFVLRDLVRAAMIKSANDSCVAIAESVAGDVPAFAKLMNEEARRAGALDSHFVNPHGLHDPNHYTTPYDLAHIARAAMQNPFFNETVRTRKTAIHGNWKIGPKRELYNKNRLLWMWNEADGVKTGYTRQAGRCLIASATRRVRDSKGQWHRWRLLSVVMHSPDIWGESARLLLDGFNNYQLAPVAKAGQGFGEIQVEQGASAVQAIAARVVELPLRKGERVVETRQSAVTDGALVRRINLRNLRAPVHRGQTVGSIDFLSRGHVLASVPLMARDDVPVALLARVAPPLSSIAPYDITLLWCLAGGFAFGMAAFLIRRGIRG